MNIGSWILSGHRTLRALAIALVTAATFSIAFVQQSFADVENVRWLGEGIEQGFQIEFDGETDYHIESLDDGRRVRLVLEDSVLKNDVSDIGGRGRTIGVFPFLATDKKNVYVDILLDSPGELVVETNSRGLQVYPPDSRVALQATEQGSSDAAEIESESTGAVESVGIESSTTAEMVESTDTDSDIDQALAEDSSNARVNESSDVAEAHENEDANNLQKSESAQALGAQEVVEQPAPQTEPIDRAALPEVPPVQPPAVEAELDVVDLPLADVAQSEQQSPQAASTEPVAIATVVDEEPGPQGLVLNDETSDDEAVAQTAESAPMPPAPEVDAANQLEVQSPEDLRAASNEVPAMVAAADVVISAASTMRAAAVTMVAANSSTAVGDGITLTGIRFSPLSGGRVQIDIDTDGRAEEPGTFVTNKPSRLALDFFGANIGFEERNIKAGSGALDSIVAIQTKDRVRLVFNLVRTVGYETIINDTGLSVILDSATESSVSATSLQSRMFPEKSKNEPEHQINKVDFRRDKDGGGRIIVELSDPKVGVDVKETAGELVVDFVDTGVQPELERRLDVVDFATPVQTIDTFRQGDHTRMIITPTGPFRQLAYQSGNVFALTISPLTEQEIEEEAKDEFGYSGEKLSLNFQKISVRAALQVIADFTGLNFVTSDSVKGSLTLRLQDVPWDQALDIILQTKGLAMRQKGNVVWVAPAAEIAAKERQQLEASRQVAELEPLSSELIQINYAKANDIAELLKSIEPVQTGVETGAFGSVNFDSVETESNTLLSPRGQVTVDERTNSLLIQDTTAKIAEVRRLVAKLDRPIRQVLIETRIVEASDDFSRVLGARLGLARQTENTRFPGSRGSNLGTVTMSGNVEDLTTINNDGFTTVNNDGLAVNLPARGIGGDTAGSFAISVEKVGSGLWNLLNLELSALEATGAGKVIASPKIMTANQQEAIIKQGQERVFAPSGFNTKPTRDEAVLLLQVKPQITPDDRLVLDVRIKQDVFVDTTINVKDKKEVQTQVLLENGETVVIGGIYQETSRDDVSKIPLLGDIPLLGNLFKTKNREKDRKELLVFLTPRILDSTISLR